jgi:hypothetical protein
MVSNESKLRCGHEVRFGQATSCEIHPPSGGGSLALSHYGGIEKEWETLNLCGFWKIECCHEKGSLSFTFLRSKYWTWWECMKSIHFWMAFWVIIK